MRLENSMLYALHPVSQFPHLPVDGVLFIYLSWSLVIGPFTDLITLLLSDLGLGSWAI